MLVGHIDKALVYLQPSPSSQTTSVPQLQKTSGEKGTDNVASRKGSPEPRKTEWKLSSFLQTW